MVENKRGWNESGLLCSQILAFKHENKHEAEKPRRKTANQQQRRPCPRQHGRATITTGGGGHYGQPVLVAVLGVSPTF